MARFDFNKFWEQIRPKNVEQKITNFSAGNVPMILVGFAGVTVVALGIMVSLNNKEDSEDKDSDGEEKGDSQPDTEDKEEEEEQQEQQDADTGVTTEQEMTENATVPNSENVTESEEDTNLVPTPEDVMKDVTGDGNEVTDQKDENDAFASFGGDNKRRSKRRRKKKKHRKSKRRHKKKRNFKKNFQ